MPTAKPTPTPSHSTFARGVIAAGGLALLACSPSPRWVAIADGPNQHVILFNASLSHADTIAFEYPDGPLARSHRLHVSNGGTGLLLGFERPRRSNVILRVRVADGYVVDQWPVEMDPAPEPWAYLAASQTLIGVRHTSPLADSSTSVSLVSPDRAWKESLLEFCRGTSPSFAPFNQGERLFVICSGAPSAIVEVDPARRRVVRTSSEGLRDCGPTQLAFSRTEGILFVLCQQTGLLLYKDRVTLRTIDSVGVGSGPTAILVRPDRPEALLTVPDRNELVLLNLRDGSVRARITTNLSPRDATISGSGNEAFVTAASQNGSDGALLRIDLDRAEIVASTPIPPQATGIAIWPGSKSPTMDWR